jgi:CubicO group peptidase (beta-lactamase class C family)
MELAVTAVTLAGFLIPVGGLIGVLWLPVAAQVVAWVRRDPGGAFVPYGRMRASRVFAVVCLVLGGVMIVAIQPRFFRVPPDPDHSGSSPATDPLGTMVTSEVAVMIESGDCVGLVVGVVDATGTHVFGFGRSWLDRAALPDGATVFEIGGVTEAFTGLLLARMVEQGKLRLDQPVQELLPDSVSVPTWQGHPIRLEHLATHRSGLPRLPPGFGSSPLDLLPAFSDPAAHYSTGQLDRFLSSHLLERAPGARVEHSDLGMGLLGSALGRAAGSGYGSALGREICEPLGMADTRVSLSRALRDRRAQGYVVGKGTLRGWRVASPARPWHHGALAGARGLHSTADDLLAFLAAQLGLVPNRVAAAMAYARHPRDRGSGIALGWSSLDPGGSEDAILWRGGATGGHRSYVGMAETRGVGVVVLSNTTADVEPLGRRILRHLIARSRPAAGQGGSG